MKILSSAALLAATMAALLLFVDVAHATTDKDEKQAKQQQQEKAKREAEKERKAKEEKTRAQKEKEERAREEKALAEAAKREQVLRNEIKQLLSVIETLEKEQELKAKKLAQEKAKELQARLKLAAMRLAETDADFVWQGEYEGCVYTPRAGHRQLGLQVVALGDGEFDAVAYSGGLPGAGWDRARRTALSGNRHGALLQLTGEFLLADVQPTHAEIRDASGNFIGTLKKVFRRSPTMGKRPSPGAIVLFDGTSTDAFEGGNMTDDGLLMVGPTTKLAVEDFYLHLEFRTPYMPYARGQGRSNSGVYIQRRYEVQILDSFGLPGEFNECGALYRQKTPDVNMALPPLSWQTYDIYFTAARFDDAGKKVAPARITVLHNGVAVHSNYAITGKTGAGQQEGPNPLPILLQNHGNPVVFRNIWLVPGGASASCCE